VHELGRELSNRVSLMRPGDSLIVMTNPPDPALSPNARVHWAQKSEAAKKARYYGQIAMEVAMRDEDETEQWEAAVLHITSFTKTNRRRDIDNLIGSLKACIDGCTDMLLPDDDWRHLQYGEVKFIKDKDDPRIELRFERVR